MKSNLLTSILTGLLLPWAYFLFVTVAPMNLYDEGVLVHEASQATGVLAYIELYGVNQSLLIYLKAAITIFIITLIICFLNDFIRSKLDSRP